MTDPQPTRDRKRKPEDDDPPLRRETRSATAPKRIATEAARLALIKQEMDELAARRAEALRNLPKGTPGSRNDGSFHLTFLRVGQGDCTLICTPQGRVVFVDGGAKPKQADALSADDATLTDEEKRNLALAVEKRYTKRLTDAARGAKFLKNSKMVDALVLTHPDEDHYTLLKDMCGANVEFARVYHSHARDKYAVGQTSEYILSRVNKIEGERAIKRVMHHDNGGVLTITLNGVPVPAKPADRYEVGHLDGYKDPDTTYTDAAQGILILKETDCSISLLAGGTDSPGAGDGSNDTNRGSLVVLVEVFDKKILLVGDATTYTEKYVMRRHKNRVKHVDIAQAGHHGSNLTSSSEDWVKAVAPRQVIVHTSVNVAKDHLPSGAVLDRWAAGLAPGTPDEKTDHQLQRWTGVVGNYQHGSTFTRKPVYCTGSLIPSPGREIKYPADPPEKDE